MRVVTFHFPSHTLYLQILFCAALSLSQGECKQNKRSNTVYDPKVLIDQLNAQNNSQKDIQGKFEIVLVTKKISGEFNNNIKNSPVLVFDRHLYDEKLSVQFSSKVYLLFIHISIQHIKEEH